MLLDSGPTLPSINESCYNATTNQQGRVTGTAPSQVNFEQGLKMTSAVKLDGPLLKKRSSACCPTPIGSGIHYIIMNRTPYVRLPSHK